MVENAPPAQSTLPVAPARRAVPNALIGVLFTIIAVELLLQAADHGLVGSTRWRGQAYQNGAFWAGLLGDWRANYALQPTLMFASYALLHAGFGHLLGNVIGILALGRIVCDRVGGRGLIVILVISTVGGGAAFGLLSSSPQPMVGASGALFGLAGAWNAWDWQDRRRDGNPVTPVVLWVLAAAVLNLFFWIALDGLLAWETHLGGFISGVSVALVTRRG